MPTTVPAADSTTGTGRTTIRLPLLLVLASLAAVAPVATDLYLPGFPAIGTDLGASPSQVQLTLTTFLVGLALGQLLMGPVSDRFGRRTPLVCSAALCVVAGVVCALAPNLAVLAMARFVQGFTGAGGMVIGRAIIADLFAGRAAAKAFTLMITVGGVAPILAPLIGGLLADPIGWRGMLWTVAAMCLAMLIGVVLVVDETHPAERRAESGRSAVTGVGIVLRTRSYRRPVAVFALSFGVMMAYISSSPYVYQNVVGLSEIGYGVAFGVNAVGLITAGWVTSRLVDRWSPALLLRTSITIQLCATSSFLVLTVLDAPAWTYAVAIFVAITANGGIMGNATALAMSQVRPVAGAGSAVVGFSQFALGALVSPLAGLGGANSALVPAVVMATCSAIGFAISRLDLGQPGEISSSTETATS